MILYSKIYGKGKPFLIFHGLFGMGDNWMTIGKKWAYDGFEVHLIDLRNHGKSPKSELMTYEVLDKDLLSYIEHYGLKNPIGLGHSLGGKILMNFCISYPKIFDKIIIADIAPKPYPLHHQSIFEALKKINFEKIKTRKALDEFLSTFIKEFATRALLLKNTYLKKDETLDFLFNWQVLEKYYAHLLQSPLKGGIYKKPSLFLKAENSDYILEEDFEKIYKYFSNAKIQVIKKARHWLQFDDPDEVYKEVLNFIK